MGRELTPLYGNLAPLVGGLITLMYGVNSRLSMLVGNLVSTVVIHSVGLVAVSIIVLIRREERRTERLPVYFYLGGFVGVGTIFASNYAFTVLSASLAVALGLLGQTLFSVAVDATGFLGRKKYPLTVRRLPGIALAMAGVAVIAENWCSSVPGMLVAFVSGVLPLLSVILNAELGRAKGVFRSTWINYVMGLATTLAIVAIVRPSGAAAAHAVASASPLFVFGGGLMGVAVVTSMNLIFPRIPAFAATILLFSGQALTGVIIDAVTAGSFDARKLAGASILVSGLAVNAMLSRRG